jgi:sterol desaturase/sphingolipid hydroxylase (fatty acid hydroxylase superfamily)
MFSLWIIGAGLAFMTLERLFPDQELPESPQWWLRAIGFNMAQLGTVLVGGMTWDLVLNRVSVFSLGSEFAEPAIQGLMGYVLSTFIYYWWHRLRHESDWLWRTLHQVHHSPIRLEAITSFYKHPFELVANSVLSGLIAYTLLGLTLEGAAWMTVFSALGEFFYHMNIATPQWVGWIIQRPEMHRIHHERGVHQSNYGDLPVWDILFGTYSNPSHYDGPCGFEDHGETRVKELLLCIDLHPNPGLPK